MSILAIALPAPVGQIVSPLLGLGVFAILLFVFKPLTYGLLRAALLVLKPHQPLQQRNSYSNQCGVLMLNRMANELDMTQPNLAAELRLRASRG